MSIFIDKFKSNVKGEFSENYWLGETRPEDQILAAAQISILFNDLFKEYLCNYKASKEYSNSQMQKILDMYMGNTMPGYVSIDCFMALVCPLMEKLRPLAEDLLDQVYQILKQIGIYYLQTIFSNKESLKEALQELYVDLLTNSKDNCLNLMTSFMDCQTKTIFTKDP